MKGLWITLIVIGCLLLLALLTSLICYFITFYSPKRKGEKPDFDLPTGEAYVQYHPLLRRWMQEVKALKYETFDVISFDGLKLIGKYYEYAPDAPIELMFHGYRGSAERDLCGGIQRCFALGRSALIVDQRGGGDSEGHTITFGINESRDCLTWIDFMIEHFGNNVKIILTGISMGGATVLIAAGKELPENVVGVLADCSYTTAKDIIKKVIKDIKLPAGILYPFVKFGARIFGGFDLEETSPLKAMESCRLPVIFIHGDSDAYVPCEMSELNYKACKGPKKLIKISGAGHGLAYPANEEAYLNALADFFTENGVQTMIK